MTPICCVSPKCCGDHVFVGAWTPPPPPQALCLCVPAAPEPQRRGRTATEHRRGPPTAAGLRCGGVKACAAPAQGRRRADRADRTERRRPRGRRMGRWTRTVSAAPAVGSRGACGSLEGVWGLGGWKIAPNWGGGARGRMSPIFKTPPPPGYPLGFLNPKDPNSPGPVAVAHKGDL